MPWLSLVLYLCIVVWVVVFFPMLLFKRARPWVAVGLLCSSYLTGFICWVYSFVVTYQTLGGFWLFVGLLFVGLGVFPLAVIGVVVRGAWVFLLDLLFAISMMVLPRLLGVWIGTRCDKANSKGVPAN
jgi:hypothetical protein